jgi:pimeloyl-ACP methyl ester carboxylesterase
MRLRAFVWHKFASAVAIVGLAGLLFAAAPARADENASPIPYGDNPAAGAAAKINGIQLYYEIYGKGEPMLQIHGNGASIGSLSNQIEFFASHYKVIAADSRGHGKSQLGTEHLTYEQMTEDLNALLEQLGVKSAYVLGWSDGGIIGLLLAIHHPDKVGKLAVMGANMRPEAAYDFARDWIAAENLAIDKKIAAADHSKDWAREKQLLDLLGKQPHISAAQLRGIAAPTLVMASDRDVIRLQDTQEIFDNIPRAHLAIFPGATHMIPQENPVLFNAIVAAFFAQPYSRPDTKDLFPRH